MQKFKADATSTDTYRFIVTIDGLNFGCLKVTLDGGLVIETVIGHPEQFEPFKRNETNRLHVTKNFLGGKTQHIVCKDYKGGVYFEGHFVPVAITPVRMGFITLSQFAWRPVQQTS